MGEIVMRGRAVMCELRENEKQWGSLADSSGLAHYGGQIPRRLQSRFSKMHLQSPFSKTTMLAGAHSIPIAHLDAKVTEFRHVVESCRNFRSCRRG